MSLADEFEAAIAGIQGLNPCFNAPLDEGILHEIETKTGFQLPEEFKNLYLLHNGRKRKTAGTDSFCYFIVSEQQVVGMG